jgi:hypothetical protein
MSLLRTYAQPPTTLPCVYTHPSTTLLSQEWFHYTCLGLPQPLSPIPAPDQLKDLSRKEIQALSKEHGIKAGGTVSPHLATLAFS